MDISLTPQQVAALQGAPDQLIPVVNGDGQERYYLVSEPLLLHLQGLSAGPKAVGRDELRDLIRQGMESPEIPAQEAFALLRSHAQKLADGGE
jgi:hypothetical protein